MGALVSNPHKPLGLTGTHQRAAFAPSPCRRNDRAHCGELPHPFNSLPPVSVLLQGHGAGYEHPFSLSLGPSQVTHTHMPHFPDKWVSRWTEVLWVSAAGGELLLFPNTQLQSRVPNRIHALRASVHYAHCVLISTRVVLLLNGDFDVFLAPLISDQSAFPTLSAAILQTED